MRKEYLSEANEIGFGPERTNGLVRAIESLEKYIDRRKNGIQEAEIVDDDDLVTELIIDIPRKKKRHTV
jgi:hypothetical protein